MPGQLEPVAVGRSVAQAIYLFLPLLGSAAVAAPVLRFQLLRRLYRPIDAGLTVRGRRVFGAHKTWRGLACCVAGCVLVVAAQKHLVGDRAGAVAVVDYQRVSAVVLGIAIGTAAIAGELLNSFVKRQLDIPPGGRAPGALGPVSYAGDQLDVMILSWPVLLVWVRPSWSLVLASVVVVLLAHTGVNAAGYLLGARRSPFY